MWVQPKKRVKRNESSPAVRAWWHRNSFENELFVSGLVR